MTHSDVSGPPHFGILASKTELWHFGLPLPLAGTMACRGVCTSNEVCDNRKSQLSLNFESGGHERCMNELRAHAKYTHKHIGMHWRCPRTANRDPELENWILQNLVFLCLQQSLLRVKCVAADFLCKQARQPFGIERRCLLPTEWQQQPAPRNPKMHQNLSAKSQSGAYLSRIGF